MGLETEVRVRLGPAEAVGRARRSGDRDGGGAAGAAKGLAAAMRAALARAEQLLGRAVPITSGYRSTEAQAQLYANRELQPLPGGPAGLVHARTGPGH